MTHMDITLVRVPRLPYAARVYQIHHDNSIVIMMVDRSASTSDVRQLVRLALADLKGRIEDN